MEPNRVAVSPALLQRFDDEFAKSGLSFTTKELKLEDFVEYVDAPLSTLHARGYNDSLGASWQFERRQQALVSVTTSTTVSTLRSTSMAATGAHTDANTADSLTDNDIDNLLFVASQQFEQNLQQNEANQPSCLQEDLDASTTGQVDARVHVREISIEQSIDELLLAASQKFEQQVIEGRSSSFQVRPDFVQPKAMCEEVKLESMGALMPAVNCNSRFASPSYFQEIQKVKESRIPSKTKANTEWANNIWRDWASFRSKYVAPEESTFALDTNIVNMEVSAISFWLQRFVLDVRKANKQQYCPDSLYQICCGLQRVLRNAGKDVNFFEQFQFAEFRAVLDGVLKQLNGSGKFIHKKKANVITMAMEDTLWEKGLLGDHSPQVLSDTMVYLNGLCFALRSGEQHRRLHFKPAQIQLVEPPGGTAYLVYKEDMSKTNQAGLHHRNLAPKEVVHHPNKENPQRCLGRLYKLYTSLCPADRPDSAFYLAPLTHPKENCWFKRVPLGHCKLAEVVPRLMRSASIPGYFTNHFLRVTAATRLYDAEVDEATIMDRTGHRSVEGIRTYKRASDKLKQLSSNVLNQNSKRVKVESYCGSNQLDSVSDKCCNDENLKPATPQLNASLPRIDFSNASNCTVNISFAHQ